MLNWHNTKK